MLVGGAAGRGLLAWGAAVLLGVPAPPTAAAVG